MIGETKISLGRCDDARNFGTHMRSRVRSYLLHLIPAVWCLGLAALVAQLGWFDRLEYLTLDVRTKIREQIRPALAPEDIVLVGVNELSLKELGRWPWARRVHGEFLTLLGKVLPSVVVWDVLFTEKDPDDAIFAEGIRASGAKVVLGAERPTTDVGFAPGAPELQRARLRPLRRLRGNTDRIASAPRMLIPTGPLAEVSEIGFVDAPPAVDGVRRAVPLVVNIGGDVYPSLALQTLMQHWGVTPEEIEVRLDEALVIASAGITRRIPIDETGAYLINYRHALLEGNDAIGYSELLRILGVRFVDRTRVAMRDLTGKILIVGQTETGLSDFGPSPFAELYPLVMVHVNVIANILAEDYVRPVPLLTVWLGVLAAGMAGLVYFSRRSLRELAVYSFGVPLLYGEVATLAWVHGSWLFPLAVRRT